MHVDDTGDDLLNMLFYDTLYKLSIYIKLVLKL